MNRTLRAIAVLLMLSSVACTRSFQVYDASKLTTHDRDYLFYALPRTVVTVQVPITKLTSASDACTSSTYNDLRTALALPNPDPGPEFTFDPVFKIGAPSVGTRSEPDPTAVYAVDLRFRPFALTTGSFELAENGLLTSETVSQEDQSVDAVLGVAKIALAAAGKIVPAGAPGLPGPAGTPGATKQQSAADKACADVKDQILQVRQKRLDVISESVRAQGASKEFLDAALGKLDDIESSLTSLFTGAAPPRIATVRCELRPMQFDSTGGTDLFIFSASSGVTALSHNQCTIPSAVFSATTGAKAFTVAADVTPDGDQYAAIVDKARKPLDDKARGFFYRIPGTALVTINYGTGNLRTREVMNIAQLGTVTTLPTVGGAFVRKAGIAPTLNAAGGLQKLTFNSEPAGNAAITGAADLLKSVQTTQAAKKAADAASKDELAQLTKQREILEEKKKIHDLEVALGVTP